MTRPRRHVRELRVCRRRSRVAALLIGLGAGALLIAWCSGCDLDSSPTATGPSAPAADQCADGPARLDLARGFVDVRSGDQYCGGAVVAPRTVLTAAHCIVDERDVRVTTQVGYELPALAVVLDRDQDYVQLELDTPIAVEPYELASGPPSSGLELTLVGRGCTGRLEQRAMLSRGGPSAEGCICRGDSGSPVLTPSGRLIGIAQGYLECNASSVWIVDVTRRCCEL